MKLIKQSIRFEEALALLGGNLAIANDGWGGQMWLTDKPRDFKASQDGSSVVDITVDGSQKPKIYKVDDAPLMQVLTLNIKSGSDIIEKGFIASYDDLMTCKWSVYQLGVDE